MRLRYLAAVPLLLFLSRPAFPCSCGTPPTVEEALGASSVVFLVYAGDNGSLGLNTDLPVPALCGRTVPVDTAGADLAELGPYDPLPVEAVTWGLLKAHYPSPVSED